MTLTFAVLTVFTLFMVALFAHLTGLAATSYLGLAVVLGIYCTVRVRKAQAKLAYASAQGK